MPLKARTKHIIKRFFLFLVLGPSFGALAGIIIGTIAWKSVTIDFLLLYRPQLWDSWTGFNYGLPFGIIHGLIAALALFYYTRNLSIIRVVITMFICTVVPGVFIGILTREPNPLGACIAAQVGAFFGGVILFFQSIDLNENEDLVLTISEKENNCSPNVPGGNMN
jgi:asparagine N-glycosylation enzyme membrane subunit Stt3